MKKQRGKQFYPIPTEAWGPGCYVDFESNTLYGADGKVYHNVEINREDLERALAEEKAKRTLQ